MNAMERVSNKSFLIGFSCGNQFVITPQIALKVTYIQFNYYYINNKFINKYIISYIQQMFVIFIRFFLLTYNFTQSLMKSK